MLNQHMAYAIARHTWVDSNWLSNLDIILQVYVDTLCQLGQSHTCNVSAPNCAACEPHEVLFKDLANLDAFGVLVTTTSKKFLHNPTGAL
jgi:hypothetical protein